MKIWRILCIALWLGAFLLPLGGVEESGMLMDDLPFVPIIIFILSFVMPIMICVMNRVMDVLGSRRGPWKRPNIDGNLFHSANFLQFFWMGYIAFILAGISACIAASFHGTQSLVIGVVLLSGGLGGWLGIRCCVKFFKRFRGRPLESISGRDAYP